MKKTESNNIFLNPKSFFLIAILLMGMNFTGCYRGRPSENPPIHLNLNMDTQEKYKPLAESAFFENGSAMRMPVTGTVARGELREDKEYYTGKDENDNLLDFSPVPVTAELLIRGRQRYDIYCAPCHSKIGDGTGIITYYNYVPPGNLHEDRLVEIGDGHLFDVISNGFSNMPAYKYQIPVADRWAIVSYVRALQRSQRSSISDIPEAELRRIGGRQ